jgi:hypothetical protein
MTSAIVSATIDEDFPVAGQDNDSQGFRDNFTIIKDGLATAANEITDLQNNVIIKGPIGDMAPEDVDNNFNENLIYNFRTNTMYGTVYTATTTSGVTTIDFSNGEYQVITLTQNSTLRFENWPDPEIGNVYSKIRVAFKTDGTADYTATFTVQGGVLTPLEGASDSYSTGTNPTVIKIVEALTSDNGENVYLTVVGDFSASTTISDINSIGNVIINAPTTGQVLKFDGTNWVNSSDTNTPDINNWNGEEQVVDASSVDLSKSAGYFITGTVEEGCVLAAGQEGQINVFVMDTYGGGSMIMNVTNPGWGGLGTVTFSSAGQGCTLQYINSKWFCVGNNGATFA